LYFFLNRIKQFYNDQNSNEENQQPSLNLEANNELKLLRSSQSEMVSLDKYKLEVEQRVNTQLKHVSTNEVYFCLVLEIFRRTFTTS
jgi:hypothetical protein